MLLSQNSWPAGLASTVPLTTIEPVPGVKLPVRSGDVATVLAHLARRYHDEVERLIPGWCWGYAYRPVRGASDLSNHSSGTAVDFNAPKHGLNTAAGSSFSPGQIAAIRRILADLGGVVRWGGDYSGRTDPMHFEINAGAAAVAALALRLTTPAPTPAPTSPEDDDMDAEDKRVARDTLSTLSDLSLNVSKLLNSLDKIVAPNVADLAAQSRAANAKPVTK